jgi:hypothetical protein
MQSPGDITYHQAVVTAPDVNANSNIWPHVMVDGLPKPKKVSTAAESMELAITRTVCAKITGMTLGTMCENIM